VNSAVSANSIIVAFRTHVWNMDVATMAARMASYASGTTFVILADETNGALDTTPFNKISHTNDFTSFGLPNFPAGQVLWYNADYPLYVLRQAFPEALSFAMIEFDVAMNVDLAAIMRHTITQQIDLIAYALPDPPPWWTWREWTGDHFANPLRLLLPVLVLSGRAIDLLFARRLEIAARKWPESPADWPYCEVFIPSTIAETRGFLIDDISNYAKLPYYTFRHPIHLRDPIANTPGNICHPVLDTKSVVQKRLVQDEPEPSFEPADLIYDPDSDIRRQLSFMSPNDFIGALTARIKSKRPEDLYGKFAQLADELGWPFKQPAPNPASQTLTDPAIVVAFRTHLWDVDIASLAAKLRAASPGAIFVILADETNELLDTAPFQKISHTQDFSHLGLPNFPHNQVLWYNADYPLYTLRAAYPQASLYAMVEYDVAVNLNLTAIINAAQTNQLDLVINALQPALPEWYWVCSGTDFFLKPWRSFLPVIIVSGRAIDHLLKRRREIWRGRTLELHEHWPFCETFIPSAIDELGPGNMAELANYADLSHYNLHDALHINDPAAHTPGTIRHRVHAGATFAMRQLIHYPALSVFDDISELRRRMAHCAPEHFLPVIAREINKLGDASARAQFNALARSKDWIAEDLLWNIAYGKPATQSSTDAASQYKIPEEDARGGNNGIINGKYGFHTAFEADPWWQVDLQTPHHITEAVLFNRLDLPQRCIHLSLSVSLNETDWQLAAVKLDGKLFGGADGNPFRWHFTEGIIARFVRITLIGEGHLHLDEIEIFGVSA